jgi:putative transposase
MRGAFEGEGICVPFWRLYYHIVWSTRDREPLIAADIETKVHRAVRQAVGRHGVTVHAVGGVEDHVHLVVEAPPTLLLSDAIGRIKGSSSYAINRDLSHRIKYTFKWQSEYGVVSFADTQLDAVCRYVENQRERHREGHLRSVLEMTNEIITWP